MFTVKRKENVVAKFDYSLLSKTIKLTVRYIDDNQISKLLKTSKTISYEKHQKQEDFDDEAMKRKVIKEALDNIEGAEVFDLLELVEPNVNLDFDTNPHVPLKYSNDVRNLLSNYCHSAFASFVLSKARELSSYQSHLQQEEIENLSTGSGIKEALKGSAKNS